MAGSESEINLDGKEHGGVSKEQPLEAQVKSAWVRRVTASLGEVSKERIARSERSVALLNLDISCSVTTCMRVVPPTQPVNGDEANSKTERYIYIIIT